VVEQRVVEQRVVEQRAVEQRVVEQRAVEQRVVEPVETTRGQRGVSQIGSGAPSQQDDLRWHRGQSQRYAVPS
jgi:hypothetical protein